MLPNPSTFEVTKRSSRPYRSLTGVTGLNAARGTAFIEDPANPGFAKLADGTLPIAGHITRNAQVGGPTIADAIMPNRIELTFADTDFQSFELAEEVQAEGYGPNASLASNVATGGQCITTGNDISGGAVQTGTVQYGAFLYSGTGANAAKTITAPRRRARRSRSPMASSAWRKLDRWLSTTSRKSCRPRGRTSTRSLPLRAHGGNQQHHRVRDYGTTDHRPRDTNNKTSDEDEDEDEHEDEP